MAKLTRKEFEKRQEIATIHGEAAVFKRRQTAIVKKVYDWQEKEGAYAWDAAELLEATGIHLEEGLFLLESTDPVLTQVLFLRESGMETENEGRFGAYTLKRLDENFWRLEKAESSRTAHIPLSPIPEDTA